MGRQGGGRLGGVAIPRGGVVSGPYDVGGTPEQNAVLALIMFATMATPQGGNTVAERLHAAGIVANLLAAAETGGFVGRDEFLRLVGAGTLTPTLERLAFDAVRGAGGAAKFFDLLDLSTTSVNDMGGPQ